MLNKSFWVIYFHFYIFSEKIKKKIGVKIYIFQVWRICPKTVHLTLLWGRIQLRLDRFLW